MTEQQIKMEKLYPFMYDTMNRDEDGSIMPWYTKGALEWIKKHICRNVTVLEFGGGHSTLWWREYSNCEESAVITVEYDKRACEILKIESSHPLKLLKQRGTALNMITYDVVIVDSEAECSRQDYILKAFELCHKFFIVDNWQQPDVCIYDEETVKYLMENSKEHYIFNEPNHRDGTWQTAIFIK